MRRWFTVAGLVLWLAVAPRPSSAQSMSRAEVDVGVGLTHQAGPSGTASSTYVTAPGGWSTGWTAGAFYRISRRLAVGAELLATGRMRATEPSRYFTTYEEERRDVTVAFGLRGSFALREWCAVEPSAALALTSARGSSRAVRTDPLALLPAPSRIHHDLGLGIGPAAGVDLRLGSARLAVVPSVRVIRTGTSRGRYGDEPGAPEVEIASIYPGGYPRWTFRSDLRLRWRF